MKQPWRRSQLKLKRTLRLCVCLAAALASAQPALAQSPDTLVSKFSIDDSDPEASVPTPQQAARQPLEMGYHLMLLSERADAATNRGDHAAAAKYWRAIAKAVPERSLSFSRMCRSYEAAGDYVSAIESCRTALGKAGSTLQDNLQFVRLVLEKRQGALQPRDIEDIDAVSVHLEHELASKQGALVANRLRCQLGVRLGDVSRLKACTDKLNALAPGDASSLVFSWSLALKRGDLPAAEHMLRRARAAKLPSAALAKMTATLSIESAKRAPAWHARVDMRIFAAATLILLAVASAAVLNRRKQRLRRA
jgi:tetratricopeptide (TPR) repeat protein